MGEVKQEYIKNKEGDIISPIVSSDSVYMNSSDMGGLTYLKQ